MRGGDDERRIADTARVNPDDRPRGDGGFVAALGHGLAVLAAFRPDDPPLDELELAERCGLPVLVVARIVDTLKRLGYLDQDPWTGRYRLALAVLGLGFSTLAAVDLPDFALPLMRELAEASGIAVVLARREGASMVCLQFCPGHRGPLALALPIGARLPLLTSGLGRAHLAALDEADLRALLGTLDAGDGAASAAVLDGVERARRDARERGYCLSLGDWRRDIQEVSVPVRARGAAPGLAVGCARVAAPFDLERMERYVVPRLIEIARRIAIVL